VAELFSDARARNWLREITKAKGMKPMSEAAWKRKSVREEQELWAEFYQRRDSRY
jgi:hypothetical protein